MTQMQRFISALMILVLAGLPGSILSQTVTDSATVSVGDWSVDGEYFDFSLDSVTTDTSGTDYVPDFHGTYNEGVNFGAEGSQIPGKRLLRYSTSGSLDTVSTVPEWINAAPWVATSWDFSNGTGGSPIAVGELWIVYTREGNYAVMEITEVNSTDNTFTFNYKYNASGSRDFGIQSGEVTIDVSSVEYFDFSLDSVSTDTSGAEFVPDFRGSSNEGVNFGEEFSGIPGKRLLRYSENGVIDTVGTVPEWTNASPWVATSWESDGTNYQPISVGELWVVYTREGHYAVMEITEVDSSDWGSAGFGDYFTFKYEYLPDGSRNFGGGNIEDQPPAVPMGLQVSAATPDSVVLTWTANSETDLDHYQVYRNTNNDVANALDVSATNSFTDTNVDSGQIYYYWVSAVDAGGNESKRSQWAMANTSLFPLQVGTATVSASASTEEYFDFSLDSVATDTSGKAYIPDFRGTPNEGVNFGSEGTLISGKRLYLYEQSTFTGIIDTVTTVPDWTNASPWVGTSWEGDGTNGQPIEVGQLWVVYTREGHYAIMIITDVSSTDGTFTFNYKYNPNGTRDFENIPEEEVPPAPPTGLTAVASPDSVVLTWDANTESDLRYYKVYRGDTGDLNTATSLVTTGDTSYTDASIDSGQVYYYWVLAGDTGGLESEFSMGVMVNTSVFDVRSGMATISVAQPEYFDFSLDSATTDTSGAEYIPDFRGTSNEGVNFGNESTQIPGNRILRYAENGILDTVTTVPQWTNTSPWIGVSWQGDGTNGLPLAAGELWVVYTREGHYAVMEITEVDSSDSGTPGFGDWFSFKYEYLPGGGRDFGGGSTEDLPPATPTDLRIAGASPDSVMISWSPNIEADLAYYKIYRSTNNDIPDSLDISATPFYTDLAVDSGKVYYYWVSAVDAAGQESQLTQWVTANTSYAPLQSGFVTLSVANSEYFDFSLDSVATDTSGAEYVPDFHGTFNEGVNFGSEGSKIPGRRLIRYAASGNLDTVSVVPEWTNASPWVETSWDFSDGTLGMPLSPGELWVVYTREGHYAVMEITEVDSSDSGTPGFGDWFSFRYKYQPNGTRRFEPGEMDLPPAAPLLTRVLTYIDSVTIRWEANLEADLDHYILYRGTSIDTSAADTLTTLRSSQTAYVDTSVASDSHYAYYLGAVDAAGQTSMLSGSGLIKTLIDTIRLDSQVVHIGSDPVYFDFSAGYALKDTTHPARVADFCGTANEGVNFGAEGTLIPGNRLLRLAVNGSLDTVKTVPEWTNQSPWIATSWESNGTNFQSIAEGELWVVYTREGHYAVMEITQVETEDNSRFYFRYKYQPNGSREFNGKTVDATDEPLVIDKFSLAQNYPNPFNPTTQIQYDIPQKTQVRISVYDMLGRQVAVLVNKSVEPGRYTVDWDGRDAYGHAVSSGVYFYRIATTEFTDVRKMVFMK
ncbi:MAG: fibronectin type III domain-containing protein [Candidatus Marinimicrobia bacterium]|nr:fibronectin type III domain-containing protein [Candidatus Neomarinimicrobiota bacterium]MCF7829576.1 fibronectin type III domain-containing protein [Candidatus Neomarinimicrobiota bacterium]MCF7882026.1 fibronectin type III domain-containing protein [Candidatus Neomarinimicrobiota bacterium]